MSIVIEQTSIEYEPLMPAERTLCKMMAHWREQANHRLGVQDTFYGWMKRFKPEKVDAFIYGAELYFCRKLNIYPDLSVDEYRPHDATLPNGATVDIKCIINENHNLAVKDKGETQRPDYFGLVIGKVKLNEAGKVTALYSKYHLVGLAEAAQVLSDKYYRPADDDKIRHPMWLYPASLMKPPEAVT